MKQNYADLTGDSIVRGVRKKNNQKRLLCLLGVIAAAAGMIGAFIWIVRMHEFFYGGVLVVLCAFGAYAAFTGVSKANKVLADVENCRLFRLVFKNARYSACFFPWRRKRHSRCLI